MTFLNSITNGSNQFRLLECISILAIIFSLPLINPIRADRVSDRIYSDLQSDHYCSRRLNATHQMGCQSEMGGNVGVIWIVEDQNDLDHVLKTGPTPPYIVILRLEYYTRKNLLDFANHLDRVAGVVFIGGDLDSRLRTIPFSPEDRCPNRYSGLYANDTKYGSCNHKWLQESAISGLLYDDIPYPIFLMNNQTSIDKIEFCFKTNNLVKGDQRKQDTYPLCSMQLDSFMLAAGDTSNCLNSRSLMDDFFQSNGQRCYTVENQNIFGYLKPAHGPLLPKEGSANNLFRPSIVDPQSVVLLMSKLSSLSMFTEVSPGADSTITSIITVLAVAEALGHHKEDDKVVKSNKNIAFAFLDSEPFDYTGSSRMVYNMQNNTFPFMGYYKLVKPTNITDALKNINLESVEYVINLDQLASYPNSDTIYLHVDPNNEDKAKFDKLADIFQKSATSEKVKFEQASNQLPLPPTSVHEFIKKSKTTKPDKKLLGVVLSNYHDTYNNLFYNSIYDDSHNINQTKLVEHLSRTASFIAKSIYKLAFEDEKDDIKINSTLIGDLLGCYLKDANCGAFTQAWHAGRELPKGRILTYKDPTKMSDDMNGAITANLLAYFTGVKFPDYNMSRCYEENDKSLIYNFQYVNGRGEPIDEDKGLCIRSQVFMIKSTSPSFTVTEEKIQVNTDYPAWTVSLNNIRNPARLFIKSSPIHQWCVFLIGVVITLMSFVIVYHIRGSISQLQLNSEIQTGTST